MAEIQFYGSEQVSAAALRVNTTLDVVAMRAFKLDHPENTIGLVEQLPDKLVAAMRKDLGLAEGDGTDLRHVDQQVIGELIRELTRRPRGR
ncbi:hypothetical protein ACQPZK_20440 [Micromonospora sp. CA-249363]|uniref:hypothetical protein n=1 Tax=Micromonospora sp. CA-249363 TaxID=3239963 RepID=UPI003D8BFB7D